MMDSPASNGGRGLKLVLRVKLQRQAQDSPASNGGRGLKRDAKNRVVLGVDGFARQQWRAWIETLVDMAESIGEAGFARQQWRAWIETSSGRLLPTWCRWIRPPAMAGVD